jgi:hypothetical protein
VYVDVSVVVTVETGEGSFRLAKGLGWSLCIVPSITDVVGREGNATVVRNWLEQVRDGVSGVAGEAAKRIGR